MDERNEINEFYNKLSQYEKMVYIIGEMNAVNKSLDLIKDALDDYHKSLKNTFDSISKIAKENEDES